MKFSEYERKLENNPEYINARNNLALHFELANAVLRARIRRGWSQKELAEAVGTKQANISRIEAGLGNPTLSLIQKIIKSLGLEVTIFPQKVNSVALSQVTSESGYENTTSYEVLNWPGNECAVEYNTHSNSDNQRKAQIE